MSQRADELQLEITNKVIELVHQKLPKEEAVLLGKFVRQYYSSVSFDDLSVRSIVDLYGAIVSHWRFIQQRKPGEIKIRVYNPEFEQQGWESTHTVIEIIQDDCPFLLDSIRMELNRRGLMVHMILHLGNWQVERDAQGMIVNIFSEEERQSIGSDVTILREAPLFLEVDKQSVPQILNEIKESLQAVIDEVRACVADWAVMSETMARVIENIPLNYANHTEENRKETQERIEFLKWLNSDNFTFLGYCHLNFITPKKDSQWLFDTEEPLGLFRKDIQNYHATFQFLPLKADLIAAKKEKVIIGKTNKLSLVHRPANPDLIAVMEFSPTGKIIGAHCFIGLYTATAYNQSPQNIPWLRLKLKHIIEKANFPSNGHDSKALINILENFPRDDFFQGSVEDLYDIALGILYLQERQKIKLFVLKDLFGHHLSCQVFVPRDRFNSQLRETIQALLERASHGHVISFNTRFSESILARIHFVLKISSQNHLDFDVREVESKIVEAARSWDDHLKEAIIEHYGEEKGNLLFERYEDAFPAGYRDKFIARTAVYDIEHIQTLNANNTLAMSFYRPLDEAEGVLRFKLFYSGQAIPLSDVIPMLECMGLKIIDQRPHEIQTIDFKTTFINDFGMIHESGEVLNVDAVKDIFQDAFYNIWYGNAENDGFNRLVLAASCHWREVMIIRAYAKYWWQIGSTFSQNHVEEALAKNATIARKLIELFILRFDPNLPADSKEGSVKEIKEKIKVDLEKVDNLNEDKIIRRFIDLIMGTIRTNYFQRENNQDKPYFSFKIESALIPDMPLPRPLYSIFVYSPYMEGIHLRGAKVARGGIRWSDRREDFRTEVLGLMKAQQVKNAVIVPLGAKGGFVCKLMPKDATRDVMMEEGVRCYQTLIRGLLDLTDNIVENKIVPPVNVIRYDEDDPYLVVAADKGTATFSDIANKLSVERQFWLGDAFASGGSAGYDHKKIGITARGAWESVKRHFREMGIDTQTQDFTVVGIGDMAGDVFGNGMLLSPHIKLVAVFNHSHIFLDPNPEPDKSFEERKRLFELPRSTWMDYNKALISTGGGVYLRSAKSIPITPQVQTCLGLEPGQLELEAGSMAPNDLIRAILRAKVDLLFNGGIGTYVKATAEKNSDVGDRTNDALRINGVELNCLVVAEGGNLGFTQLGRVEYAMKGGKINTDAIDNSGGVDCSDHEVNIKILLNAIVAKGDMTPKQRNQLLEEMTDEVAQLVLKNNISQAGALSLFSLNSEKNIDMLARLIRYLEDNANLDRKVEFLPDNEALQHRKISKQGLTRSELAVLFAYTKIHLKQALLASSLPEDSIVSIILETAFPKILVEKYAKELYEHRLKREIIVMQVANQIIDKMGLNFITRLQDETGSSTASIIQAYMVSKEVFDADSYYKVIDNLPISVNSDIQFTLKHEFNRLIRRGARWFLRHNRSGINIATEISDFKVGVEQASKEFRHYLRGVAKENFDNYVHELVDEGIPADLALTIAIKSNLFAALDIVEAAKSYNFAIEQVMSVYFMLGDTLELNWFDAQINDHPVATHWDALARASYRDDLYKQQRTLTIAVLKMEGKIETQQIEPVEPKIENWMEKNKLFIERWQQMIAELKLQPVRDFTMYSVAIRELLDLTQTSARVLIPPVFPVSPAP